MSIVYVVSRFHADEHDDLLVFSGKAEAGAFISEHNALIPDEDKDWMGYFIQELELR